VMRIAAFTVDVDRDVNLPANGNKRALSKCHVGDREEVRFDSALRGLAMICEALEELGIAATFFFEGDTLLHVSKLIDVRDLMSKHEVACHGICHEDITGESTGIRLADAEVDQVIDDGREIVRRTLARDPLGFRAPYQHIDSRTLEILEKRGFLYDSSMTVAIEEHAIRPWKAHGGLWELPLAQGKDERGRRIVSYLWPMHEGKRSPADYVEIASKVRSGALVLATHSWHVAETYGQGILSPSSIRSNLQSVRDVLEGTMAQGMEFITLQALVGRMEA